MASSNSAQQSITPSPATRAAFANDSTPDNDRFPEAPGYIAVEGPIGVGKTTLSRRLADTLGYPLLLEPAGENPFLDRFYRDPRANALPTQLYFLLHRAQQMQDIGTGQLVEPNLVADFLLEKDRLFAELTLDAEEYALYEQIYESLNVEAPTPDLVVYLQAPTRVLQRRIRARGIQYERYIDEGYLDRLTNSYAQFFHYYEDAPLLIVNAAEIDLADNDGHYNALLEEILAKRSPRQYFNPHPTLL